MRYFLAALLLIVGFTSLAGKRRYRGEPRSEVGLMNNVVGCLSHKDSTGYFYLFPPFDSLWALVMHPPDRSPEALRDLNHLKEHPKSLLQFDPMYNHQIMARFLNILMKGEDSGIHWDNVVIQRYELSRMVPNRELIGYSRIVPERFKGYLFVRDIVGRLTFCITITEIQKINGYFFGGQVLNMLEASTIEQYLKKEVEEQKYFDWLAKSRQVDSAKSDSVKNGLLDTSSVTLDSAIIKRQALLGVSLIEDDSFKGRREVVDRRYYEGKFDEEIPVKLFVRYMKDLRTGKINAYDGLYKFGDQVSYVLLHIVRSDDGKWTMEDDPPIGTMELELKNRVYTGSWTNNDNQTGYDVELKQTDITAGKLMQLEKILDLGLSGRVDEASVGNKSKKDKADKNTKGNEDDKEDDKPVKKEEAKQDDKPKKRFRSTNDDE